MNKPRVEKAQGGFSLVELMIALVVGLILLAGVLQILLGNRESFEAQRTMAGMQQNSRLASFVIENVVAHAGYRTEFEGSAVFERLFPAAKKSQEGVALERGAVVGGTNNSGPNKSDVLRLRFQAEGGVHDCLGRETGVDGVSSDADMELYLSQPSYSSDLALYCAVYAPDGSREDTQALVEQVERFKVRYGLDSDDDGAVDKYTNALAVGEAEDVRSLRLQLLLKTDENVKPQAETPTFAFADGSTFQVPTADRRARELLDQTVALRNLLQ